MEQFEKLPPFVERRNQAEMDAFWEEHKDDEEVKILCEALEEALEVFYLTEDEMKAKIKEIICSKDLETAKKLTYAIQSLAINESEDFKKVTEADEVAKRQKFANDALSALMKVHFSGCGEVRDAFFEVMDSAKSDFNINSMAIAKKSLFSTASMKRYENAVEAVFANEKWARLGIKFSEEEFKNMVEHCSTLLLSARKKVVDEVIDLLADFSRDESGNYVLNVKEIVKNCSTLLITSPENLRKTIAFLNENYDRADVVENVRNINSILLTKTENVENYRQFLEICLAEIANETGIEKDAAADAKANCKLQNLTQIDKMTDKKLENMCEITKVLLKNKIDPETAYNAVKNLTLTYQIDAKSLDAFLCYCCANEDKGGRELMKAFFNSPSLAVENEGKGEANKPAGASKNQPKSKEAKELAGQSGMTQEEAKHKLDEMSVYSQKIAQNLFSLVSKKLEERHKSKPRTQGPKAPKEDPTLPPETATGPQEPPIKPEPEEIVPPTEPGDKPNNGTENGDGETEKSQEKRALVIPDFSDCEAETDLVETVNRVLKFFDENDFHLAKKERKVLQAIEPALRKIQELDKGVDFAPLQKYCKIVEQTKNLSRRDPKFSDLKVYNSECAQFFDAMKEAFEGAYEQISECEKQIKSIPEYRTIRDFMRSETDIHNTVVGYGEGKAKPFFRNSLPLHNLVLLELLELKSYLEKGDETTKLSAEEVEKIMNAVDPHGIAGSYQGTPTVADNNLAIYKYGLSYAVARYVDELCILDEATTPIQADPSKLLNSARIDEEIFKQMKKDSIRPSARDPKLDDFQKRLFANIFMDSSRTVLDKKFVTFVDSLGSKKDYETFKYSDTQVAGGQFAGVTGEGFDKTKLFLCIPKTIDDATLEKIGCTRLIPPAAPAHLSDEHNK